MPIYEYSCEQCQAAFEVLVRGAETPQCPDCGGTKLEKLLSVPAAHSANPSDLPVCPKGAGAPACGMGGPCGMPDCGM
jgi:putative FmdB family regulatory protein